MKIGANSAASTVQAPDPIGRPDRYAEVPNKDAKARVSKVQQSPGGVWSMVAGLLVAGLLCWGWFTRESRIWNPEVGLGYALGIAGLSCVGLLLIYPLRKRIPGLRLIGTVPFWFHSHMLLGVIAPVMILFHCNFQLGSINSNIALFTMLVVGSSGLIGRFLYVRIHRDMSGRKRVTREILSHAEVMRLSLQASFGHSEELIEDMRDLEEALRDRVERVSLAIAHAMKAARETGRMQRQLHRDLDRAIADVPRRDRGRREALKVQARAIYDLFDSYRITVNEAARLALYERFFALWHVLHLPLFFLMLMAAAIHVVAVHLY